MELIKGSVMISNYIQPDLIKISEVLELKKYYPYYKRTIAWYSDLTVCKQVDNIDHIYDMARLKIQKIQINGVFIPLKKSFPSSKNTCTLTI